MESDYQWLVAIGLVTSSVIAVAANAFLLFVFSRRRSLRTIPNRFVLNLLIINLLSSILLIPLVVMDQKLVSTQMQRLNTTVESIESNMTIRQQVISINGTLNFMSSLEEIHQTTIPGKVVLLDPEVDEESMCYFAQASTSFVCTASIFSILLIGINQYFGVIHSLRYHFYVNRVRASLFIMSSWFAAIACSILSIVTYSDGSLWNFCSKRVIDSDRMKIINTTYAFSYFICVILVPCLAICVIYVCIYTAARQNSERMRKSTSASSTAPLDQMDELEKDELPKLPRVHSAPNFSALESSKMARVHQETLRSSRVKRTNSDRNNFIVNLKHKISNASVFRYREETRAAKISVLVILMVLVCYVPYGLNLILTSGSIDLKPGQNFNYLSLVLLVFSNIISPFVFGYRNKRVKREIGKMLGFVPASSSPVRVPDVEGFKPALSCNRSLESGINLQVETRQPLLEDQMVPEVVVTCKVETERKSILKRVGSGWSSYKKCNFITVPDSCLGDARGSFSSASTQISSDD
ncbi:alpha-1D adrenergic receptor isoform X2 [Dendroctonus ponderosae]|nr:alpha-1D adrenergic receptor isoform X2 [Dendroctonus ponderosae]